MFGLGRNTSPPGKQASNSDSSAISLPIERLIELRAEAVRSRIHLPRGITPLPGLGTTRLRGRGLDFDEIRPYAEGDDVRHIDWNVTARTGRPHTRLYREERERAVTVAVDMRASMFTGSRRLKAVAAGEYAAAILWRVSANRDRAGVLAFDDRQMKALRPATRQNGVLRGLGEIVRMFGEARGRDMVGPAHRTLDGVVESINRLSVNSGLIVLLTDCHGLGPDFDSELAVAGQRRKLAVLRIADPLELVGLPAGTYTYRSEVQASTAVLGSDAVSRLRHELAARNTALERRFVAQGIPCFTVASELPPADIWGLLTDGGLVR